MKFSEARAFCDKLAGHSDVDLFDMFSLDARSAAQSVLDCEVLTPSRLAKLPHGDTAKKMPGANHCWGFRPRATRDVTVDWESTSREERRRLQVQERQDRARQMADMIENRGYDLKTCLDILGQPFYNGQDENDYSAMVAAFAETE